MRAHKSMRSVADASNEKGGWCRSATASTPLMRHAAATDRRQRPDRPCRADVWPIGHRPTGADGRWPMPLAGPPIGHARA